MSVKSFDMSRWRMAGDDMENRKRKGKEKMHEHEDGGSTGVRRKRRRGALRIEENIGFAPVADQLSGVALGGESHLQNRADHILQGQGHPSVCPNWTCSNNVFLRHRFCLRCGTDLSPLGHPQPADIPEVSPGNDEADAFERRMLWRTQGNVCSRCKRIYYKIHMPKDRICTKENCGGKIIQMLGNVCPMCKYSYYFVPEGCRKCDGKVKLIQIQGDQPPEDQQGNVCPMCKYSYYFVPEGRIGRKCDGKVKLVQIPGCQPPEHQQEIKGEEEEYRCSRLGSPGPLPSQSTTQQPAPGGVIARRAGPPNSKAPNQQQDDDKVIVVVPGYGGTDDFGNDTCNKMLGTKKKVEARLVRPGASAAGEAMVPRTVILHIVGTYESFLRRHQDGLVAVAHNINRDTSFMDNGWNRGIIKQAVSDLLDPGRSTSSKCSCCNARADWIATCCGLVLCTSCLPERFIEKHNAPSGEEPCCRGQGALGLLDPPLQYTQETRYIVEGDLVSTRQIIVQTEDEENRRTRLRDVFVLRSVLSLGEIWRRSPCPRRSTVLYLMRWDGYLLRVFRMGRELPFLQ